MDRPHIRWFIRRDMAEVLTIEADTFPYPWDEAEFVKQLRRRDSIGMIAELCDRVVGYTVYRLDKTSLEIINLAVHRGFRGRGIGYAIIEKLKNKLSSQRRTKIIAEVWEFNTPAQLWFKRQGFFCTEINIGLFRSNPADDAYRFEYAFIESEPQPTKVRIATGV